MLDTLQHGDLELLAWEEHHGAVQWLLLRQKTSGAVVQVAARENYLTFEPLIAPIAPTIDRYACPVGYVLTKLPGRDTQGEVMEDD